jgi:hypothetical protein
MTRQIFIALTLITPKARFWISEKLAAKEGVFFVASGLVVLLS